MLFSLASILLCFPVRERCGVYYCRRCIRRVWRWPINDRCGHPAVLLMHGTFAPFERSPVGTRATSLQKRTSFFGFYVTKMTLWVYSSLYNLFTKTTHPSIGRVRFYVFWRFCRHSVVRCEVLRLLCCYCLCGSKGYDCSCRLVVYTWVGKLNLYVCVKYFALSGIL